MNVKGGMDEDKCFEYTQANIIPKYHHAKEENGKQLIFEVDHGPGSGNENLLAMLRMNGLRLYLFVPNTTHTT